MEEDMGSLIEKNDFQILRGGVPGNYEGCHGQTLEINDGVVVESGHLLSFDGGTGKYNLASLADGGAGADLTRAVVPVYVVIEGNSGNDSFSGEFTEKAAGLKGAYVMQTKKFNAAGMVVGAKVSVVAGLLEVSATKPTVGVVTSYDAVSAIVIVDML